VTDIDNEDEVIDDKVIEKSLNKESEDNKLIQNKNEYDFTAPLDVADAEDDKRASKINPAPAGIPPSKSNNSISGSNSNSLTNTQRGVKFLSDYSMLQNRNNDASEPLLRSESNPSRFKVTHVQDSKKIFFKPQPTVPEYFLDEKGSLIINKKPNDEEKSSNHSKPRKFSSPPICEFFV
jgi:hypothetical protein